MYTDGNEANEERGELNRLSSLINADFLPRINRMDADGTNNRERHEIYERDLITKIRMYTDFYRRERSKRRAGG
jgi:hypothetical protein